jgi:hypothetical protein
VESTAEAAVNASGLGTMETQPRSFHDANGLIFWKIIEAKAGGIFA